MLALTGLQLFLYLCPTLELQASLDVVEEASWGTFKKWPRGPDQMYVYNSPGSQQLKHQCVQPMSTRRPWRMDSWVKKNFLNWTLGQPFTHAGSWDDVKRKMTRVTSFSPTGETRPAAMR